MAYYPSTVKNDFSTKVNFTDTILASHVNDLQGEVTSVETYIGTSPHVSGGWVGSFDQITTTWNTLKDRIQNIEYGLGTAYNNFTSILGGSTIQSSTTGTTSLVIKAKPSQTANLLELQLSDGTVVSKVDASGNIYTSNKQVVPIVYAASQPSSVPAGTIWVDSSSNPALLTAQSGIPSGGTSGQYLVKSSGNDYDVTWGSVTLPTAETLSGTTLKSTITGSSLTSVGTLTSLSVSGSVSAASFSGNGSGLTNVTSSNDGILILMGAWM